MIILSIETSCDETAIAIIEGKGGINKPSFKIIAEALHSQIKLHEKYGGVFPMMAKREHQKTLTPILIKVLKESDFLIQKSPARHALSQQAMAGGKSKIKKIEKILNREETLLEDFKKYLLNTKKPKIDRIVVTEGPGLEPALWVGISFAKALGILWDITVFGVNHMEGHIMSVLPTFKKDNKLKATRYRLFKFPALSLLISGGHTELVYSKKIGKYEILGKTRDDAIGEAFDKVARILGLPYPGGPAISVLAEITRKISDKMRTDAETCQRSSASGPQLSAFSLPRPMIHSKDLDFSFSGIKTAVLYMTQKIGTLDESIKKQIAMEFENAVTEVLVSKTRKALVQTKAKTLIIGGGVSANIFIRKEITKLKKEFEYLEIIFPEKKLSTDNAIMIGIAGYLRAVNKKGKVQKNIKAKGNLELT